MHAATVDSAVIEIEAAIAAGHRGYICLAGVHGIMEAQRHPALKRVFANALLVLPDGMPTVWMGRLQGLRQMDRVFGPDLMLALAKHTELTGHSHFLYGGQPGVAERLRTVLLRRFPSIRILGTYTPPFRTLTTNEEAELFTLVDELRPDIIWVGLSTPKQERFMAEYLSRLNARILVGVGAAFDFHSGAIQDSPRWVKQAGLQWFHRLLQEPGRLWKRYLRNNPAFMFQAVLQLVGVKRHTLS